jgi:hypothetical protein
MSQRPYRRSPSNTDNCIVTTERTETRRHLPSNSNKKTKRRIECTVGLWGAMYMYRIPHKGFEGDGGP